MALYGGWGVFVILAVILIGVFVQQFGRGPFLIFAFGFIAIAAFALASCKQKDYEEAVAKERQRAQRQQEIVDGTRLASGELLLAHPVTGERIIVMETPYGNIAVPYAGYHPQT